MSRTLNSNDKPNLNTAAGDEQASSGGCMLSATGSPPPTVAQPHKRRIRPLDVAATSGEIEPAPPSQRHNTETAPGVSPSRSVVSKQLPHQLNSPRQNKTTLIIALLHADNGASVSDIMASTGWQAHSIRGFFSGTVRKKLRLNLVSRWSADGVCHYKIEPKQVDPTDRCGVPPDFSPAPAFGPFISFHAGEVH